MNDNKLESSTGCVLGVKSSSLCPFHTLKNGGPERLRDLFVYLHECDLEGNDIKLPFFLLRSAFQSLYLETRN